MNNPEDERAGDPAEIIARVIDPKAFIKPATRSQIHNRSLAQFCARKYVIALQDAGFTIIPAATVAAKDAEIERMRNQCDAIRASREDWMDIAGTRLTEVEVAESALEAERRKGEALAAALEPFAAVAEVDVGEDETDADLYQVMGYNRAPHISVGHLRLAMTTLSAYRSSQDAAPEAGQAAQRSEAGK